MRGPVYPLASGRWKTVWQTSRSFATEEEAREAATSPVPVPEKPKLRIDPGIVQLAARLHDEASYSWKTVATALDQAGIRAPRGGPWRGNSISGAVQRAQAKRAEHDRRAVHSEWHVPDD